MYTFNKFVVIFNVIIGYNDGNFGRRQNTAAAVASFTLQTQGNNLHFSNKCRILRQNTNTYTKGITHMMGKTHKIGGNAIGLLTATILHTNIFGAGIIIAGALIGSMFPDIDNKNSRISHKMKITSRLISAGRRKLYKNTHKLSKERQDYIWSLAGHRGITHSLIGSLFLPLITIIIGLILKIHISYVLLACLGTFLGYLSHLLLDMISGGVPLLLPFSTDKFFIAQIKTRGDKERIVRACLIIITMFLEIFFILNI